MAIRLVPRRCDGAPRGATRRRHAPRAGFALEPVLMVLALFPVVVLAGLGTVSTVVRSAGADYQASRTTEAAEGASDDLMAQLDAAMQDGQVSAEEVAALTPPGVPGYTVATAVESREDAVLRTVSSGPFAGLYSMNRRFDITVGATDSTGARAGAVIAVNALSVPIFQTGAISGAFYSPPHRKWSCDPRVEDPANLPPGTPAVGSAVRTAYRPVH